MVQNQPKPDPVKPKQDHKMKADDGGDYYSFNHKGPGMLDMDKKGEGDDKKQDGRKASAQKVPRVRRIVGAQMLNGESLPMTILNSSNPNDLQAQLALFLQQ